MFAVAEVHFDSKFLVKVFGYVLGTINGTVLTSGATEGDLKVGEATVEPALGVEIDDGIDVREELEDFSVFLKEVDDGLVESGDGFVFGIATRVVGRTAVEYISSTVA